MGMLDGERLESECIENVKKCDLLISIVKSRFGTPVEPSGKTFSQLERECARENSIQTITFVHSSVMADYNSFLANNRRSDIKYLFVTDIRIFKLLDGYFDEISPSPRFMFTDTDNLVDLVRMQIVSLTARMYQKIRSIRASDSPYNFGNNIVKPITSSEIDYIRSVNHPVIISLIRQLGLGFRLVFRRRSEFIDAAYALGFHHFHTEKGIFVIRVDDEKKFMVGLGRHILVVDRKEEIFVERKSIIVSEMEKRPEFAKRISPRKSGYFVVGFVPSAVFVGGDFLVDEQDYIPDRMAIDFFAFHVKQLKGDS